MFLQKKNVFIVSYSNNTWVLIYIIMEVLQIIRFPHIVLHFKRNLSVNKGYDKVTYGILAA